MFIGNSMDLFAVFFYIPLYNIIIVLYHALQDNLGLSIIALAIIFRALTFPLTVRQLKFSEQSREMQDRLKEVKKQYKHNKEKLQQEQMKVQQEYLPGQLSGCLPMIFQAVIISQIFIILRNVFVEGTAGFNKIAYSFVPQFPEGAEFNTEFLGLSLATNASAELSGGVVEALPYVILAVSVAVLQFINLKVTMGLRDRRTDKSDEKSEKESSGKDEDPSNDFSEALQRTTKQTMYMIPSFVGVAAFTFPAGLALYWTVQSGFVIIQQFLIHRIRIHNEQVT